MFVNFRYSGQPHEGRCILVTLMIDILSDDTASKVLMRRARLCYSGETPSCTICRCLSSLRYNGQETLTFCRPLYSKGKLYGNSFLCMIGTGSEQAVLIPTR